MLKIKGKEKTSQREEKTLTFKGVAIRQMATPTEAGPNFNTQYNDCSFRNRENPASPQ